MELITTLKKPYTDIERADFVVENNHRKGYEIRETKDELQAWGYDSEELFQQAKQNKIAENDTTRDKKLLEGVTYSNVLFDSDNEQKINLLAKYSMMSDIDTVVWYGMDNQPLLCKKDDLMAIGQLIETLHTFCWENNAYIKEQIAQAETLEQLEEIDISYDRVDT